MEKEKGLIMPKVLYTKASDDDFKEEKEFYSWNDMIEWMKENHDSWIMSFGRKAVSFYTKTPKIEVEIKKYDDYVE